MFQNLGFFWILSNLKNSLNLLGFGHPHNDQIPKDLEPNCGKASKQKIPGKFHKFHQQSPPLSRCLLQRSSLKKNENSWEIEPSKLYLSFSGVLFSQFPCHIKKRGLVLQAPEVPRGTPKEVLRILSSDTRCSKKKSTGVGKLGIVFQDWLHMWSPKIWVFPKIGVPQNG